MNKENHFRFIGHIVDCVCNTNQKIHCNKRTFGPKNVPSDAEVITPNKNMDNTVIGICSEVSTSEEKFVCNTQPEGITLTLK